MWVLEGPEGERALWSDLFGVMNTALVTPETVAPAQQRQDDREAVAANRAASPSLAKEQATPASDKSVPSGQQRGLTPAGLSAPPAPPRPDARP